jgi:hypothetical protein
LITLEQLNERGKGALPGHLGIVITKAAPGEMQASLARSTASQGPRISGERHNSGMRS